MLELGNFKKVHTYSMVLGVCEHYEYDDVSIQISLTPTRRGKVAIHVIASNFSTRKGLHRIPSNYADKLRHRSSSRYAAHEIYSIEDHSTDSIQQILNAFNKKITKALEEETCIS